MKQLATNFIMAVLIAQSHTSARDADPIHVPKSAEEITVTEAVKLNGKTYRISIEGAIQGRTMSSVLTKLKYSVTLNEAIQTEGEIVQTAEFAVGDDRSGKVRLHGNRLKNDGRWITMVRLVPRKIKDVDLIEYACFVVVGLGEFGSGDSLFDESLYDHGKETQIVENDHGHAVVIKIASVFLETLESAGNMEYIKSLQPEVPIRK